jgi:hypothetical protein
MNVKEAARSNHTNGIANRTVTHNYENYNQLVVI